MNINIKATNIELTAEIKEYINKKITKLEKFFPSVAPDAISVNFEIAQKGGQQSGEIYHSDCVVDVPGNEKFYAQADSYEVNAVIDEVESALEREIKRKSKKRQTMLHRGGRRLKNMLRSATSYRPWKK